jgi:hypothetical protein
MMDRLFVDMDGVLANFNKGIAGIFGVPYPQRSCLGWEWIGTQLPQLKTGMLFYDTIHQHDRLYAELEPYPWHSRLVTLLDLRFPAWEVLTNGVYSPHCWSGKVEWMTRYFGRSGLHRLTMTMGHKSREARPGAVLIDDRRSTCEEWTRRGGLAFHWRDYTPDAEDLAEAQIQELDQFLLQNG